MNEMAAPIDSNLLQTFALVAETRHFTRAAERAGVGQSAVSMQIRRLEDQLQLRLFTRANREVRLTPEGEILLRYAHQLQRMTEETLAEIGRPAATGRLRVGATDTSMIYLPPVLRKFHARYPGIDIDLQCTRSWEALDLLDEGAVDLAFVTQHSGRRDGRVVTRSPLVWVCAADSEADLQDPVPLAIFGPGCIYRKTILQALDRAGKAYHLAYESTARAGLDCAVDAGLAVTVMPQDLVREGLRVIAAGASGLPRLPVLKTFLFGASPDAPVPARHFAALLAETFVGR